MNANQFLHAAVALALALPCAAEDVFVTAKVVSVEEGDLVTIERAGQSAEQARLYGVDAPESDQPFSKEARQFVEDKAKGKEVSIELVTQTTDGIPVIVVRTPEHENLSQELLKSGLAWWDENNTPDDGTLKSMNAKAIGAEAGLWKEAAALAPWDYRKSHGGAEVIYQTRVEDKAAETEKEPTVLKAKGDPNMKSSLPPASPSPAPAPAAGGLNFDAAKDIDVNSLLTRHQPELTRDASGNVIGLTAKDISQIPFASMLGFQDGDVLTSVNGTQLQSEGQILGLVSQLKGAKNLQVGVLRNGQQTTLNINLP
ncbi:MAG: PDZ domain-containing protein [Candidatus Hydrogenedens sp.]|nr:PDZ domain-containing protein [Candidatus Hydrogenedens sp.]